MTVYIVAQLRFTHKARYMLYQSQFGKVFSQFGGQLLCADENPRVLEGQWERDKIVIMSFTNDVQARVFLESSEYAKITKNRVAGAQTFSLLVNGLAS